MMCLTHLFTSFQFIVGLFTATGGGPVTTGTLLDPMMKHGSPRVQHNPSDTSEAKFTFNLWPQHLHTCLYYIYIYTVWLPKCCFGWLPGLFKVQYVIHFIWFLTDTTVVFDLIPISMGEAAFICLSAVELPCSQPFLSPTIYSAT